MTLLIKTTGWEDYLDEGGAYIKALVMGAPGAGKTRSASFWPKPIFADCEKGRMSIADRGIPYAEIRNGADMDELLDHIQRECARGKNRDYQTFVVDTFDSYQRALIAERLKKENKESLSGWADWGYLDGKMTQFLERLLNLPMNIVVNLHVKEVSEDQPGDDDTKLVTVNPKLKGDMRYQIAAEFDLVGYMGTHWGVDDGKRVLKRSIQWMPEPRHPILKDRSGRLPAYTDVTFAEQDYQGLYDRIISDHVESMPETTVVAELETREQAEPAGSDEQGGAVATKKQFPRSKKDKQDPPPPPPPPGPPPVIEVTQTGDAISASTARTAEQPEGQPEEEVPAAPDPLKTSVSSKHDEEAEAVKTVQESLGGKVVSEPAKADEPTTEAPVTEARLADCGDQPPHLNGVDGVKGCGKPLADQNIDRVNVAVLKTRTWLCNDCFQDWKQAN